MQEQIEAAGDHAFGAVFHRHYAKFRTACAGGVEDFVEITARQVGDAGAKKSQRRFFAESAVRPQVGYALRRLQGPAGRHDFAPDEGHACRFEQAGVGLLQVLDDLRLALGAKYRRAFSVLDDTDFMRQRRALVEQLQQRLIQRIDLDSELGERLGHGGVGL